MIMKTFVLLLITGLLALSAAAQEKAKPYPKYRNLNYNIEKITLSDDSKLSSKYGAAFTTGRSYYVHKKPLLGMIRIGIDATWFDLNYANYEQTWVDDYGYGEEEEKLTIHKAEIGMQVGPSVTVNPVGKLNAHVYFRYAPTFAALYDEDAFRGNYASFFVTGISVSYGVIGLGIEKRWGDCKYKEFGGGSEDEEYGSSEPFKLKTSGMRVYLSFRLKR